MGSGSGLSSTPAPAQTPTFPAPSAGDKYAALAELFDTGTPAPVSAPVTQVQWSGTGSSASDGTINWSGTTANGTGGNSINWSGGAVTASSGSSSLGWNSQPVAQTTSTPGFGSATTGECFRFRRMFNFFSCFSFFNFNLFLFYLVGYYYFFF